MVLLGVGGGGGGGRRGIRRYWGRRRSTTTANSSSSVLPIRGSAPTRPHHHRNSTISCWYCDMKISAFNQLLFSFGRKHARLLRIWFSMGTGFGITALLAVSLILFQELVAATLNIIIQQGNGNENFYTRNILFGFLPSLSPSYSVSGFTISLANGGYILISTFISVAVHEFGHAIAAASEGIRLEYIAIYIAVLFPGALVAFNYESLQTLPQFATLRIYCAGIWHNAVCCAACALALILLPLILYPFYTHGENPMVLDVTSTSPLSSYLSRGDLVESVDGLKIRDPQEWMEMMTLMKEQSLQNSQHFNESDSFQAINAMKGYCIPGAWMEDEKFQMEDDRSPCPDRLTAFSSVPCLDVNVADDGSSMDGYRNTKKGRQCFNAGDVVQLEKCGKGWLENGTSGSKCVCSQDEICQLPNLVPGLTWVEISYKRPYSSECLGLERNSSSLLGSPGATDCGGTFVFIGDVLSIENSVQLTAYQPRWALKMALDLPNFLEKLLTFTFHVSLTLALLNSLPVFLLDGESILEVIMDRIPFLSSRKRAIALQICLLGGTLLSILACSRVMFNFF